MRQRHIAIAIIIILLATVALACGGGGGDPIDPNPPGGQNNGTGATIIGRILDREGAPVGKPWVDIKLSSLGAGEIAPAQQPSSDGPNAGEFKFIGLPTGIELTLEIGLFQPSLGRNLGYIHKIKMQSAVTIDLGDITLENDFLDNGWSNYVSKDYSLALLNFNRSLEDRFLQTNLSYSSSAHTGMGWVYAKRGKDATTGLYYIDPDTGEWLDYINEYEWDQALAEFNLATANSNDSDAFVGLAGAYLTLLGSSNKDPVLIGPEIPFYSFVSFYFDESEEAINKALAADPNYNCSHDKITANDLRATLLFLRWMEGKAVPIEEVASLATASDLNKGSKQLLDVMPDLLKYNPYPQL